MRNSLEILLPDNLDGRHCPEKQDVVTLYKNSQFEELNKVVICKDGTGNVAALFGDLKWNCKPLLTTKNAVHRGINFSVVENHPSLFYEFKLICYGWFYTKNKKFSMPTKASTIIGRASGLSMTYEFALKNGLNSIFQVTETDNWRAYLSFLEEKQRSAGTLVHILCALQQAYVLAEWLNITPQALQCNPTELSKKLCRRQSTEREQTLTIPERIADKILYHAVSLVESAWAFRTELGETERLLQENYEAGEKILREKILSGQWKWLSDEKGNPRFDHDYAKETFNFTPYSQTEIIEQTLNGYPGYSAGANGAWWHLHRANIMASCFICCAAFSGMRESELFELTQDSYYNAEYNGKVFHFLKAKTHKLGEKHTEWVVAPIVKMAVELVATFTDHLRVIMLRSASTAREKELAPCLWISQGRRSTAPKLITGWGLRLKNFAKNIDATVTEEDYLECLRSNPNSINKIKKFVVVGRRWHLTPHQFRRTLAFFTIKNRLGNAIALKQQFKHLYLQMSEWYCEGGIPSRLYDIEKDYELQKLLDTVGNEQIANKYWSWFNGNGVLSGRHGKEILKLRNDIPLIYSSWESVYRLVKDKKLTLHGTMHGYCKNGYDCDMGSVTNPAFCVDCDTRGSIIDEEQAQWWKIKHQSLIKNLSDNPANTLSVYTHCLTQIRAAEKVMTDFSIQFDIYHPPIEMHSDD